MHPILKRCLLSIIIILLCNCSGGDIIGTGEKPDLNSIYGTAAIGNPIANALVEIKIATGEVKRTNTNEDGKFSLPAIDLNETHLLRITASQINKPLYSFASTTGITNIHPYTDLIVRNWFAANNLDIDEEFNKSQSVSAQPTAVEIRDIKQQLRNILALALHDYNIPADLDLMNTEFDANGTGFDLFLDNSEVVIQDNKATVIISNSNQGSATIILNELNLSDSIVAPDILPPTETSTTFITVFDETSILIVWSESTDNVAVAGYNIYRDSVFIGSTAYSEYIDSSGLTALNGYCYEIEAFDAAGNVSPKSTGTACQYLDFVPRSPLNLTIIPRGNATEIRWDSRFFTDERFNWVHRYKMIRVTVSDGSVDVLFDILYTNPITSYIDTNLGADFYCYRIDGSDISGSRTETIVDIPISINCSFPTNFTPKPPSTLGPTETAFLFLTEKFYAREGIPFVDIHVKRVGDLSLTQSVQLIMRSGSATSGDDYTDPSGTVLTWLAGQGGAGVDHRISIAINSDTIDETSEFAYLELTTNDNVAFLGKSKLFILD